MKVLFARLKFFAVLLDLVARSLHAIGKSLPLLTISPKRTFAKKFLMPRSQHFHFLTGVLLISVLLISAAVSLAEEIDEPIVCNGDEIEYFEKEKKVVGTGNIVITYKDTTLTCDKVTVWADTKDAKAEGNVRIVQGNDFFTGETMTYNLEKETGTVVNFTGYTEPWYSRGKSAERTGPDEFIVHHGYITSCDLEKENRPPHYRISGRKVLIYPDVKVVIRDATVWVGPVPVLWIPVYAHPLDDDRPHVTIIPGKNDEWGMFTLTAWRYNLDPNHKGYVHMDYRERKDFGYGFDHVYDTNIIGKGILKTYYMHERDLQRKHIYTSRDKGKPTQEEEKFIVQWRHKWQMFKDTTAVAELYKYRDKDFRKDYYDNSYNDEYAKDPSPRSYLLVTKSQPFYNLSVFTEKRANRFETIDEKLPEVKLTINNSRIDRSYYDEMDTDIPDIIKRGALYYSGEFSAVNLNAKYPRSTDENPVSNIPIHHNNRYDTYNRLSYASKLSFLNVTPYTATRQTYYDRGRDGRNFGSESHIDGIFYTGVDVSTKFYKVFYTEASPLGMEINNLRHIITPSISYNYRPPSTRYGSDIYGFLGGGRGNSMSFTLENKLQTKRGKDKETIDFARLGIDTSYDFTRQAAGRKFSDYKVALELLPYNWLTITSDATIDSHKRYRHEWLKEIGTDFVVSVEDYLRLGISHGYTFDETNNIIGQLEWNINSKWKIKAFEDFDIKRLRQGEKKAYDLKEQRYVITRDLHCWEVDVHYNVFREKGEEILVIFRLKAFPNMPFEFGRNYHEPKRGRGLQTY
ncbi:MAG: LPS-assembly protein LptD [Candidatus Omnitrophota bacterium]|nr:MAG: LPS-assembly protein LptD [Candidatus Omnitrophota bacterium]